MLSCGLSGCQVFPHFLINGTNFGGGELLNIKCVLIFSTTFIRKEFSHTPFTLHTSHAIHVFLQLTAQLVLSLPRFSCKPQPFSHSHKCCQHINNTFHSWTALCSYQSGISNVLKLWREILLPDVWVLHFT